MLSIENEIELDSDISRGIPKGASAFFVYKRFKNKNTTQ